jgi:hypothetical protein
MLSRLYQAPYRTLAQLVAPKPELSLGVVDAFDLDAHADMLAFIQTYAESPENADGAIRVRPVTHYAQAFATGLVVRGHRGSETTFVQLLYPQPGKERFYVELGTVLNRDQRRGLMEPVVRAVIQRVLATWPGAVLYAVAKPGSASAHVLEKVGMRGGAPEPGLLAMRRGIDLPLPDHKRVFVVRLAPRGASTAAPA